MSSTIADELGKLIRRQKETSFIDPTTATDEKALGIMVSQFTSWDGAAILRIAAEALVDANFHSEAEKLQALAEKS